MSRQWTAEADIRGKARDWLFVMLLATGVALAGDTPRADDAALAVQAQAPAEAEPARTEAPQAPAPQRRAEEAQGRSDEAQVPAGETRERSNEGATVTSVPGGSALGMSILGNQEAPTSLVIVPWKTSELGDSVGVSPMLDDARQPVDRDVFMRSLRYYEISSNTRP